MGADFSKVIPSLLEAEGIEAKDNAHDYGGLTKYGISQKAYPNLNIQNLTFQDACTIYTRDYWNHYQLNNINDQTTASQIFLLLINMNPIEAIKIVQRAINVCGRTLVIVNVDGILGAETFSAINQINRFWFHDRLRVEALTFYLARVDEDKTQEMNLPSWCRRILI